MGQLTLFERLREFLQHAIFKVACRFYLWSIGEKTLDGYLTEVENRAIFIAKDRIVTAILTEKRYKWNPMGNGNPEEVIKVKDIEKHLALKTKQKETEE